MYSAVYGKTEKRIEILPYSSRKGVGRNVFGSLRENGKDNRDIALFIPEIISHLRKMPKCILSFCPLLRIAV